MIFHVPGQVGRPPESLATLSAFEGPLSSMKPLMTNEQRMLVKNFPTYVTFVALALHGQILQFGVPGALVTNLLTIFQGHFSTGF